MCSVCLGFEEMIKWCYHFGLYFPSGGGEEWGPTLKIDMSSHESFSLVTRFSFRTDLLDAGRGSGLVYVGFLTFGRSISFSNGRSKIWGLTTLALGLGGRSRLVGWSVDLNWTWRGLWRSSGTIWSQPTIATPAQHHHDRESDTADELKYCVHTDRHRTVDAHDLHPGYIHLSGQSSQMMCVAKTRHMPREGRACDVATHKRLKLVWWDMMRVQSVRCGQPLTHRSLIIVW